MLLVLFCSTNSVKHNCVYVATLTEVTVYELGVCSCLYTIAIHLKFIYFPSLCCDLKQNVTVHFLFDRMNFSLTYPGCDRREKMPPEHHIG